MTTQTEYQYTDTTTTDRNQMVTATAVDTRPPDHPGEVTMGSTWS